MTLWTRAGLMIPICWIMGFVVFYWADRFAPGFVPEKWVVTIGHMLGTIFVLLFAMTIGVTAVKEVMDVETEEKTIVESPHKFLIFNAMTWGIILTLVAGWMLYSPPPKSVLDKVFMQKDILEKKIKEVSKDAKDSVMGEPVMREWVNSSGKKLTAKMVGTETVDGKDHVLFIDETGKSISYDLEKLSQADRDYVKSHSKKK